MKFRIAHLSDCHFAPEVWPSWRELMSKRIMGYINWRLPIGRGPLARAKHHDMSFLNLIFEDIKAQNPDHCVLTGDLVNFSLVGEFRRASEYLMRLGTHEQLTCVPGNHDAYVRGAEENWSTFLAPWMQGDFPLSSSRHLHFPYVRRRGSIALIGLSSAIPTHALASYGALGPSQLQEAEKILKTLGQEGVIRIVLIHHPPHMQRHFGVRKILADAPDLQSILKSTGAELVLHGHIHKASVAYMDSHHPHIAPIPIVGAPSASANYNSPLKRAGYNLIECSQDDGQPPRWTVTLRAVDPSGKRVHTHGKINLEEKGKCYE
jgi:3',5'-cyclic AMP phosphodiesterase CpdA